MLVELAELSVPQFTAKGRELLGVAIPNTDAKGWSDALQHQLQRVTAKRGQGMSLRGLKRLVDKLAEMQNRPKLHKQNDHHDCLTIKQETQSRAVVLGQNDGAPPRRKGQTGSSQSYL